MKSSLATKRTRLNRVISWLLVFAAIGTIITGYLSARDVFPNTVILPYHLVFEVVFVVLFIEHLILSLLTKFYWKNSLKKIYAGTATSTNWLKLIQRVSGVAIIGLGFLVIISGLDWYALGLGPILPFTQHLAFDLFFILTTIIHVGIGMKFALTRRGIKGPAINGALFLAILVPTLALGWFDLGLYHNPMNPIIGTKPNLTSDQIWIEGNRFSFDPTDVDTIRPDLFKPGFFSVFDILVHLSERGDIKLQYHFDASMNTHLIDSLQNDVSWWYEIYYDGGWPEANVFRMDHYPWKDGATLTFRHIEANRLARIYREFRNEVSRLEVTGGQVIISRITIRGVTVQHEFENITVTPHDLRDDALQEGVVTAIDIIMSLGDQGLLEYQLQWYEGIGSAGIVKSYWIEGIDTDVTHGGCGFVYETGADIFQFKGNHIHLPSDMRIINSPEYGLWFWICL